MMLANCQLDTGPDTPGDVFGRERSVGSTASGGGISGLGGGGRSMTVNQCLANSVLAIQATYPGKIVRSPGNFNST